MKRSWKTTLGGCLATAGKAIFGWPIILAVQGHTPSQGLLMTFLIIGLTLDMAGTFCNGLWGRDNDKTSEDVGVDENSKFIKKLRTADSAVKTAVEQVNKLKADEGANPRLPKSE